MEGLLIRPMGASDVEAVASLGTESFESIYPSGWSENAQSLWKGCDSGAVYVAIAELEGEAVGYGNLRRWPAGGWIDQLAVRRTHRRRGIGLRLFEHIVRVARDRGLWKVSLIASEMEPESVAFLRALGMEEVGRMRDEIRKGVDGVLLSYVVDYALHPNPV